MGKRQVRIYNNNLQKKAKLLEAANEIMILMAVAVPIIKGNLGFDLNLRDGDFVIKATVIHDAIQLNTGGYYAPPFAQLAALATAITTLQSEIYNVSIGVLGAEGAKMVAKRAVMKLLKKALYYINLLSFDDQINAVEIITGAKMLVNKPITKDKQDFSVKHGISTGEILLAAKAVKYLGKYVHASYEWQFSIDNGTTWENLPVTTVAKTTAEGMLPGIATIFRKRTTSPQTGLSPWCDPMMIYPI